MKNTILLHMKADSGTEALMEHGADSSSALHVMPERSSRFRRLGQWLAARIEAHNCRVSSLRVFQRQRLDQVKIVHKK